MASPRASAPPGASLSQEEPTMEASAAVPLQPPPPGTASRYIDPDRLERNNDGERALFSRHVLSVQDGRRVDAHGLSASSVHGKSNGSPRAAVALLPLKSGGGPIPGKSAPSPPPNARSSPRSTHFVLRPSSPVGIIPVESVVTMSSITSPRLPLLSYRPPPGRAALGTTDVEKITAWLNTLARESRHYASYALYCEMLFRESSVLTRGKPVPNRLQTAVAFHCLCRATGVFSRHEEILHRICRDLGAAIYLNHDDKLIDEREIDALDFFTRLTAYYDHHAVLQQQKEELQQEMLRQKVEYQQRLDTERARNEQVRELEHRLQVHGLDKITHRNTLVQDLRGKLSGVLQKFYFIDDGDKQDVVLSVISSLRATISADTLLAIAEEMSPLEKEKVLRGLFKDEIGNLTTKIEAQVALSSSVQQNAILDRSASRITRFQSLISGALNRPQHQAEGGTATEKAGVSATDDLSDYDRKILEAVEDTVEELERARAAVADLTAKLQEAEQLASALRIKNNDMLKESDEARVKFEQQIAELQQQLELANPAKEDKDVQTEGAEGGGGIIDGEEGDDEFGSMTSSPESGAKRGRRRGLGAIGENDDGLICKNRPKNKFGFGIASIIDQAKIPSSTIRKILVKRKPLTLLELHSIIVGYYQAKMFQDAQDDMSGKPRANLAQFIMEMYVLHYGLKDLAISQLVFLDAAIRKNAKESARVRTFGLLTGALDPESHACSVQGIDFFLLLIVILFNAGALKKGRKQAETIAKNLKESFGDGIFLSPKALTVKFELVCRVIDLAFSYTTEESGGTVTLELLKEDIQATCAATTTTAEAAAMAPTTPTTTTTTTTVGGGTATGQSSPATVPVTAAPVLDIDLVIEKIMNYWFVLYEQQIGDINAMFSLVDANGDGTLDFDEFCDVVDVLEPNMDRRDALALYTRAAGDDHVIDKDEFVQLMLAHQRGIILRELYSHESNGKKMSMAVGKQNSMPPPPQRKSLPPRSTATTLVQMDKDGSYASLAAAMADVMPSTESETAQDSSAVLDVADGNTDEEQREQGEDSTPVEDSDEVESTQENISFQTLSRLSVWASEARGKLLGFRETTRGRPKKSVMDEIPEGGDRARRDGGDFKDDVDELLRLALSKADIDPEELL